MVIAVPCEGDPEETRVAATPQSVERLVKLGAEVRVEKGAGLKSLQYDAAYEKAGARLADDRLALLSGADIVLRVGPPDVAETGLFQAGSFCVSHLNPFAARDVVLALARGGVSAASVEMIPRTTRAQKMDALSSQASLAGYVAALLAAERLQQVLPMMVTPAGTLSPARVFVIGAGVAGLQAIATAKRLGAVVDAFDTRPVVEEQVRRSAPVSSRSTSAKPGRPKTATPGRSRRSSSPRSARPWRATAPAPTWSSPRPRSSAGTPRASSPAI